MSSKLSSMAGKSEIKLLGMYGSPYVARAMFALKLKSIDYEFIMEGTTIKSDLLLRSNPAFHKVPVLFHANKEPISETLVIIEYLEEILPNFRPLLPSTPAERAQHRFWAYYFDTQFVPWFKEIMLTQDEKRREELKNLLIEGSKLLEEAFNKLSKGKPFFGGDDIGYLDVVLGGFLGFLKLHRLNLNLNVFDEVRNPKLAKWEKRMWSCEETKSVIPSHEIHIGFREMLLDMMKAITT